MHNLSHIDYFIELLEQMENRSKLAVDRGVEGDEIGVRVEVDALRVIHHKINLYDISFLDNISLDYNLNVKLEHIQSLKIKIAKSYQFITQWVNRYTSILSFEELAKTEQGIMAHIDSVVPLIWDWSRDILILVGSFPDKYFNLLLQRGQKNVLIIDERELDKDNYKPYIILNNVSNVAAALSAISRPLPTKSAFVFINKHVNQEYIQSSVNDALQSIWVNVNTINFFENRWINQGINNLYDIARSHNWTSLRGQTNKEAAVIVSAGPSLDKNLHVLPKVSKKAYIICVAQALPTLINNGIYPDLVVVIDPVDYSHILKDLPINSRCDLLIGASCNKAFRGLNFKNIYTFDGNIVSDKWILNLFGDEPVGASGGSVSVSALLFAVRFGFRYIALIGQDLSISGNRQYASDSPLSDIKVSVNKDHAVFSGYKSEDVKALSIEEQASKGGLSSDGFGVPRERVVSLIQIKGCVNDTVYTTPDYYEFYLQFISIAKNLKGKISLYNCTEGGAHIDGYMHIDLSDFYYLIPFVGDFKQIPPKNDINNRVEILEKFLLDIVADMNHLKSSCLELISLLALPINKRRHMVSDVSTLEREIFESMANIPFLELGMQKDIDVKLSKIHGSVDLDSAILAEISLLESIIENISKLINLVENIKK